MNQLRTTTRRSFLASFATWGSGALLASNPLLAQAAAAPKPEIGPAEDLMREHGGLNRILLIYEEGLRRIQDKSEFDPDVLKRSATLIRTFIEDYHEKLEEEFLFPHMRKLGKLVDLVNTLEKQHKAGRPLTMTIEKLSVPAALKNDADKTRLSKAMSDFIRMYRPHESREDTILFPAFHQSLSEKAYDDLGEKFEDREHKLFGKEGFDGVIAQIETLEKAFGIYDLAKFTPPVSG
jgi:hemerythrin-like domain-containing protein